MSMLDMPVIAQAVDPLLVQSLQQALEHHASGALQMASATAGTFDSGAGRALLGGMLSGATAGAAVDFALYPIDTIKTRLQVMNIIMNIQVCIE
jgi:hypothetical protein